MTDESIQVVNKIETTITEVIYTLKVDDAVYVYTEWLNVDRKIIDSTIHTEIGSEVEDQALINRIWQYIDTLTLAGDSAAETTLENNGTDNQLVT